MKTEADRADVKHADLVEDMLAKHSKELEDAGMYHIITAISWLKLLLFLRAPAPSLRRKTLMAYMTQKCRLGDFRSFV